MEASLAHPEVTPLPVTQKSELLLPNAELANCIFGAFVRDTRGCALQFEDRFNYFAASPLCGLSWVFEGKGHLLDDASQIDNPGVAPMLPAVSFSGPQQLPPIGWNPGEIYSMVIAFYPDAFHALTGLSPGDHINRTVEAESVLPAQWFDIVTSVHETGEAGAGFQLLCDRTAPLWKSTRSGVLPFGNQVSDWTTALAVRAATSAAGRSARQIERRIKAWAGQSRRELNIYGRNDKAFQNALAAKADGSMHLAEISADTGYSDQAHMTRQVKEQTGFSPAELMRRMDSEEAFWSFRLLGQRY